jgi:hypothetical protein
MKVSISTFRRNILPPSSCLKNKPSKQQEQLQHNSANCSTFRNIFSPQLKLVRITSMPSDLFPFRFYSWNYWHRFKILCEFLKWDQPFASLYQLMTHQTEKTDTLPCLMWVSNPRIECQCSEAVRVLTLGQSTLVTNWERVTTPVMSLVLTELVHKTICSSQFRWKVLEVTQVLRNSSGDVRVIKRQFDSYGVLWVSHCSLCLPPLAIAADPSVGVRFPISHYITELLPAHSLHSGSVLK